MKHQIDNEALNNLKRLVIGYEQGEFKSYAAVTFDGKGFGIVSSGGVETAIGAAKVLEHIANQEIRGAFLQQSNRHFAEVLKQKIESGEVKVMPADQLHKKPETVN